MSIDHVKLPVSDLDASRAFYSAALAPFGIPAGLRGRVVAGVRARDGGEEDEPFAVERTAAPSVPSHIAFTTSGTEQVDAFYAVAVAAGRYRQRPAGRAAYCG